MIFLPLIVFDMICVQSLRSTVHKVFLKKWQIFFEKKDYRNILILVISVIHYNTFIYFIFNLKTPFQMWIVYPNKIINLIQENLIIVTATYVYIEIKVHPHSL